MAKQPPQKSAQQPTVTMSQEMFNKQYELIINLSSENSNLRNYASMLEQQLAAMQSDGLEDTDDESTATE